MNQLLVGTYYLNAEGERLAEMLNAEAWAESVVAEMTDEEKSKGYLWLDRFAVDYVTERLNGGMRRSFKRIAREKGLSETELEGILIFTLRDKLVYSKKGIDLKSQIRELMEDDFNKAHV